MSEILTLRIYETIGGNLAVASEDGQKVFGLLMKALQDGRDVQLSFVNIDTLTSAFLNAAIGQLYGTFKEEFIRQHLSVADIAQDDLALLKRVVDGAKAYFKDPKRAEQARREESGKGEDDDE